MTAIYLQPASATLDVRTCERLPKRVRSIQITDTDTVIRGEGLKLLAGYNTDFTQNDVVAVDGGRAITDLTIGATPGAGLGRTPGCISSDIVIRRINGIRGDDHGNFIINTGTTRDGTGGGCYRIERPGELVSEDPRQVELVPNTLQITNDCGPCCDCPEFMAVYEAIRKLRQEYLEYGQRATTLRDQYRENLNRWNEEGVSRMSSPLRLSIFPLSCCKLGVTGAYCNSTGSFIPNLQLKFNFSGSTVLSGDVVCDTTFRAGNYARSNPAQAGFIPASSRERYTLAGDYPTYSAFFSGLPAGGLAIVTFQLDLPNCQTTDLAAATLEALDPDTGNTFQYNAGWPSGENLQDVESLGVRSGLLPNNPCVTDGCAPINDELGFSDSSV